MSKKKIKIILISGIALLGIVATIFIIDYIRFIPNDWVEGDVSKWENSFPDNAVYEMGLRSDGVPMFKEPLAALKQFKIDYKELLNQTAEKYDLTPLNKYNVYQYTSSETPRVIFLFCKIFECSISESDL